MRGDSPAVVEFNRCALFTHLTPELDIHSAPEAAPQVVGELPQLLFIWECLDFSLTFDEILDERALSISSKMD